ncbi:MAG: nuclear transport factor 2 family protein [Novosphingobium sp.]|nr:nuclear transport factor 2 family protein [Novosphingobium sp.]
MAETQQNRSEPDQLARLGELLDRQDIYDCIKRISRAIDRFDRDMFLSSYHPDAVIDAGQFVSDPTATYDGGEALHEAGQDATLHHLTNHVCEVEGDTAHAETYFLYVGRNKDGSNWAAGGRYNDRLERREGAWKIAFRYTNIDWSGMVPETQVPLFTGLPDDAQANGTPSRSREDPSYRRPLTNLRQVRMPEDPTAYSRPEA